MNQLVPLSANKHAKFSTAALINLLIPGLGNLATTGLGVANFVCLLIGFAATFQFGFKIKVAWFIVMAIKAYVDIYVSPSMVSKRHQEELKKLNAGQYAQSHDFASEMDHAPHHKPSSTSGRAGDHAGSIDHEGAYDHPGSYAGSLNHAGAGEHPEHAPRHAWNAADHMRHEHSTGSGVPPASTPDHHESHPHPHPQTHTSTDAVTAAEDYFNVNLPKAHVNHPHPVVHENHEAQHHSLLPYQPLQLDHSVHPSGADPSEHSQSSHQLLHAENPLHPDESRLEQHDPNHADEQGEFGFITDIYADEECDTETSLSPLEDGLIHQLGEPAAEAHTHSLTPLETGGSPLPQASHQLKQVDYGNPEHGSPAPVQAHKKREQLCPTCQKPREHRRPVCPACGTHFEDENP